MQLCRPQGTSDEGLVFSLLLHYCTVFRWRLFVNGVGAICDVPSKRKLVKVCSAESLGVLADKDQAAASLVASICDSGCPQHTDRRNESRPELVQNSQDDSLNTQCALL